MTIKIGRYKNIQELTGKGEEHYINEEGLTIVFVDGNFKAMPAHSDDATILV
jgi:hypothetical protein